ncbi:hypothetical protein SAMN04515695_6040 [Pseudovibrio sp. Tun.PSC04-5.I4]|nr:hypothetical protein SAMN04515695_6040 [Pseudovibrio sp. Tun.PSC04-5.I4]
MKQKRRAEAEFSHINSDESPEIFDIIIRGETPRVTYEPWGNWQFLR